MGLAVLPVNVIAEEDVQEEKMEESVQEETAESEPVYNDLVQYELWVGPVRVTSENKDNILGSDTSRASFDPATSTLTLYGTFTGTDSIKVGIYAENMDLKIEGEAEINVADTAGSKGIFIHNRSLTISGDIKIIADHRGINVYNSNLVFDSGEIYVEAKAERGEAIVVESGQAEIHDSVDRLEAVGGLRAFNTEKTIFKEDAFKILEPETYIIKANGEITNQDYSSPRTVLMESANHFTVNYNPGDGSGSMKKDRVFTGEKYYLPECTFTAPEEMKFAGWLGEDGKTYAEKEEKDITADCTFTAQWIPKYDLTVGGVKVTKENKSDIFRNGTASYDSDTYVLTLNGTFDYRNSDLDCFIKASKMDLTIAGNSEILISNKNQNAIGINVLSGSVWVDGDLTISGNMYGIYSENDLTLASGKIKITANGTNNNGYALRSWNGNLVIDDGITTLEAEGTASAVSSGTKIVLGENLTISTPENGKLSENERWIVDENNNEARKVVINKKQSYEVSYEANGAGGTMASDVLYEGQSYTLTECAFEIPEDMVFAGWMDEAGDVYGENDPYPINKDTVFSAQWKLKYDLMVGGVKVDVSNKNNIPVSGGTAVFNSETNTLTLNGNFTARDTLNNAYGFIEAKEMNLRLEGKASVTLGEDSQLLAAVNVLGGTLTLAGDFELTGKGMAALGDGLTIESGSLYAETLDENGISISAGEGSLTIGDDAERIEAACGDKPFTAKEYNISKELIMTQPENGTIKDGRVYDENGSEVKEVVLLKRTEPYFNGHQLVLTGSLGLRFRMDFPKGMTYEDGSMSFFVNGVEQIQPTPLIDNGKFYYTCYLTSLQMAETIEAVYTYGDNQTVTQTYSLEKYFSYFDEHPEEFEPKTLNLIKAVANYGYYAQPYLSNLHNLGDKYAKITKNYPVTFDYQATLAETEKYAFSKSFGNSKVEAAAYKLSLDTDTILSIRIKVPAGTQLSAAAVFAGDSYGAHSEDGTTYIIEIPSIKATRLDEMITVFGYTNDDDQNEKFSISVCPLSYVRSILKSNKSDEAKNTVCALYEYYKAVKKY